MNDEGVVEIDYIFTFMISAMLLTMFTIITSNIIDDFTDRAIEIDASELMDQIEISIENVVSSALKDPFKTIEVRVEVQQTIRGSTYSFSIENGKLKLVVSSGYKETRDLYLGGLNIVTKYTSVDSIYRYIKIVYTPERPLYSEMTGDIIYLYSE